MGYILFMEETAKLDHGWHDIRIETFSRVSTLQSRHFQRRKDSKYLRNIP